VANLEEKVFAAPRGWSLSPTEIQRLYKLGTVIIRQ